MAKKRQRKVKEASAVISDNAPEEGADPEPALEENVSKKPELEENDAAHFLERVVNSAVKRNAGNDDEKLAKLPSDRLERNSGIKCSDDEQSVLTVRELPVTFNTVASNEKHQAEPEDIYPEPDEDFGTVSSATTPQLSHADEEEGSKDAHMVEQSMGELKEKMILHGLPSRPQGEPLTGSENSSDRPFSGYYTPTVTCQEPSDDDGECGGVSSIFAGVKPGEDYEQLFVKDPKVNKRYFQRFEDALGAVKRRYDEFDVAPLIKQVSTFKDKVFEEEKWERITTEFSHLRIKVEDHATHVRQLPMVQHLLKAADDALRRLGAVLKTMQSSSIRCLERAHDAYGSGLYAITPSEKMTGMLAGTLTVPKCIPEGLAYVTSNKYVKKAIDLVPPPITIIEPIAGKIGRSGKHVAERLAIVDKVVWINDKFGVSVYAVSLDKRYGLAGKLEAATGYGIHKVAQVCKNKKVSLLIDRARILDETVSAGKIHSVAEFGYDKVMDFWRRYAKYKSELTLAAQAPASLVA